MVLVQHRLGVEGVHLRHAAVHDQKNDMFGFGLEVGRFRRERVRRRRSAQNRALGQKRRQPYHAEAAAGRKRFPARQGKRRGRLSHINPRKRIRWS